MTYEQPTGDSVTLHEQMSSHWRKLAVGALAASTLVLGACTPEGLNPKIQKIDSPIVSQKTGDKNDDPAFRADTVTLFQEDDSMGSGVLTKNSDGQFRVVTVEHVARGFKGLGLHYGKGKSPDYPEIVSSSKKPVDFNVPGVGVMVLTDKKPDFVGSAKPRPTDGVIDRAAVYDLNADEQKVLQRAESKDDITTSEIGTLAGKRGDVFTMPLADTGKDIPYVFIQRVAGSKAVELAPLYLLDQGLDYKKGMQNLNDATDKQLAADRKANGGRQVIDRDEATMLALSSLQSELFEQVKHGDIKATDAALQLPCIGDSGSGILNNDKQLVGVLSAGETFYGSKAGTDDMYLIHRKASIAQYCLSTAVVSPVK